MQNKYEISQLESQNQEKRRKEVELELQEANKEIDNLVQHNEGLKEMIGELENKIEEKSLNISDLEYELEAVSSNYLQLEEKYNQLLDDLEGVHKEKQKALNEHEELKGHLKEH